MAFSCRNFQDDVLRNVDRNLYIRYHFLRGQFNEAVMDMSANSGLEDGIGRIANGLKWVFKNHKIRPGFTLVQDTWTAKKVFNRFGKVSRDIKTMRGRVTDEDLQRNGLTEGLYIDTLEKVLNFIAWAYDITIYDRIIEMINQTDRVPTVPDEELNRLTLDSFAANITPRIPVIFIVDNSVSMDQNGCLGKLDAGLTELIELVRENNTLSHQLELCIVTCGGKATEIVNFDTIDHLESQLNSFIIQPYGRCMMASAIELALERLDDRIRYLRSPDVNVDVLNCPWMIVLSNGKFAQDMDQVKAQLEERINRRSLMVYWRAFSETTNMDMLRAMPAQESGKVQVLNSVNGFFKDINISLSSVSESLPGSHVELQNKSGFVEN